MDWIHCNTCSRQPGDQKDRQFALTSCGHIYCDLCVVASTKEKCRVCGSQCNTVQLTSQMRPDVQHFFTEPEDVLKKALQIMDFQKGHRQRLTSYRRSMVGKDMAAADEINKLRKRVHELEGQVSHLKGTIYEYEKRGRPPASPMTPMRSQTPLPVSSNPSSFKSPPWPSSSPGGPSGHGRGPAKPSSQSQLGALQSQAGVALSQRTPPQSQSQPHSHHSHLRIGQTALQVQSPQQHVNSPAKSDSWVTPNRLTLKKPSPSQSSQPSHSPGTLPKARSPWNNSPGIRLSSQVVSPLSKRPPSRISPYMPMRTSQVSLPPSASSQGTMTMSPKDRFLYLSSQPGRK